MKLALALAVMLGCSAAPKQDTTTSTTSSQPTSAATEQTVTPAAQPATATTPTATTARTPASAAGKKPQYSCFTYVAGNTTTKRYACMRSDDCGPYLEQATRIGGFRELSGCANVPAVYCFHQVATKDEPEGLEVCQPTLDACKAARADVVKAKMSVDTDCAAI